MSAIVTDKIKKQFLLDLFRDFDSSPVSYYAGIGRSEQWDAQDTVAVPNVRERDERDARYNMQSMKQITDRSFVIPRSNWSSGAIYSAYDDNHIGYPAQHFYVMNSNQEVYICVQQGRDATGQPVVSTQQPTGNTTGVPFQTSDGYRWKFVYSIGALRASKFLSSSYMPVQFVDSDEAESVDATAEQVEQRAVEKAARPGEVIGVEVINSGSGYTSTPSIQVNGDGSGCELIPVISGNSLVNVIVKLDSDGNLNGTNPPSYSALAADKRSYRGHGYKRATVSITGGGGQDATGRVILGPENGLGADPRDDLKSGAVMFNAKVDGAEAGDFLLGDNTFRQVLLIRNPLIRDSATRLDTHFFTDATGNTLDRMTINGINGTWVEDRIVSATSGNTPFSQAYIDAVDSVNATGTEARLLVHQNETTGFTLFEGQGSLAVEDTSNNEGTIVSYLRGEVDPLSGELLYIDNRAAVDRSAEQTEDLKIVIQL
jgi:hypothetical protein